MISFTVHGIPRAQPRVKARSCAGHAQIYDPGTADDWKLLVSIEADKHRPAQPMKGAVELDLHFSLPRPKSHLSRNGNLKPNAPNWHVSRPDVDNLQKALMDVLSGCGYWLDDRQVAQIKVTKMYGLLPCCVVNVRELTLLQGAFT